MQALDTATVQRIKECKRYGFPICLEKAIHQIFHEKEGDALINRSIEKLKPRLLPIESANQVFTRYDEVLFELGKELGNDVSDVIAFQCLKEIESMGGCTSCPLYLQHVVRRDSPSLS